ncbi:MAG TPA: flagellar hook-basal body complex protein, partial [Oxalicibacterium sp.]
IDGDGFFQVLMPDGTTAYTRDGNFKTNDQGQLTNASGFPIDPAITIPPDATSMTISADGIVSVTTAGNPLSVQIGSIQLATFINPGGLESRGDNLYMETTASGAPVTNTPGTNGSGTLKQNYLETSNVNVVEELVNMIQTQRAYEMNSKAITTSDQMLQRLTQM